MDKKSLINYIFVYFSCFLFMFICYVNVVDISYVLSALFFLFLFVITLFNKDEKYKYIVRLRDGTVNEISVPIASGTHMGGDDRMVEMLFGSGSKDELHQCADSFDGFKSCIIGIAANKSIKEGVRVELTPILDKLR